MASRVDIYAYMPEEIRTLIRRLYDTDPDAARLVVGLYLKASRVEGLEKMLAYYRWVNKGTMDDDDYDRLFG